MKFTSVLTGEEITEQQLKDWYKVEIIPDTIATVFSAPLPIGDSNNGGKTSYYDLPLPKEEFLSDILSLYVEETIDLVTTINLIRASGVTTLNDLIEYKDMYPFQHEIFKACYALQERANKDIKGGSILRELNKMKYYIERGIALAKENKI